MKYRYSLFLAFGGLALMVLFYVLSTFGLLGDSPVGQTSVDSEPLVVPAGYAFSIWGPIYIGLLVFPFFQLFKKRYDDLQWHRVRIWYAWNVVANGLWLAFASYNWLWTTVFIIAFMLFSLYKINTFLIRIKAESGNISYWGERLVFSLYFAWVTLATVLNVASALSFYEWGGFGISEVNWSIIILTVTVLIAGLVFWKYKDMAYAAVVIWAFLALVVKHWEMYPVLAYLSIGVMLLFTALIFLKGKKWAEAN